MHGVSQTHAVPSCAEAHVLLHTPTVQLTPGDRDPARGEAGALGGHSGTARRRLKTVLADRRRKRRALRRAVGPVLECEALVKIAYTDQGTRDGLLANLAALIEDTTVKLQFGQMVAGAYLEDRGPFQERLPLSGLMWRFLWEYHVTVLRWARWARDQVEAWPEDLSQLDAAAGFDRIVSAASSPWTDQQGGFGK